MKQLTENLWIANIQDISERSVPSDVVISVCQDTREENTDCKYLHFNMSDGEGEYGGECNYQIVHEAINNVIYEIENGNSVTVHCHAGQSRSASVCIGAIACIKNTTYNEAFNFVKDKKPDIRPNPQLEDYVREYLDETNNPRMYFYDGP